MQPIYACSPEGIHLQTNLGVSGTCVLASPFPWAPVLGVSGACSYYVEEEAEQKISEDSVKPHHTPRPELGSGINPTLKGGGECSVFVRLQWTL